MVREAQAFLQDRLPWLQAGIVKTRNSPIGGGKTREAPVRRDARPEGAGERGLVRARPVHEPGCQPVPGHAQPAPWAKEHLRGKTVLNTFAYTGSLGVAALAGGASRVVQMDLNRQFLNLAKTSYTLNGFPIHKGDFLVGDFWTQVSRLKRAGERFDCVLVDPPFFSATPKGVLDLNTDSARLINKVRPLINDGGWLVSVNNALYVSGKEYLEALEGLCADGYLEDRGVDPGPGGFHRLPGDPAGRAGDGPGPFNHSTKIAVLEVKAEISLKFTGDNTEINED